jgi:transposase
VTIWPCPSGARHAKALPRRTSDLVAELGIANKTLYKWRRQALIDAGRRPGAKSFEADPLLQARRRIKELEAELKAVKAASALFEEGAVDPKASSRLSEG